MTLPRPAPASRPLARLMPIDGIDDWAQRIARTDAFWERAIIDRPVVCITVPKTQPPRPWPRKTHATPRERWFDCAFVADCALASAENHEFLGDALPCAFPNLGPEVFSAFFGHEMDYTETTSWSIPNLLDWAEADSLHVSRDNFYWRKLEELTDTLLEVGKNRFYTGISDLHPGGDAVAAFRGPEQLAIDLIEAPEQVQRLLARLGPIYLDVFDFWHAKLTAAGQAITSWPGIVSSRKWYVPSNDFSCMISEAMFDEFFLPGIAAECRAMDASIYHLDGPDALRHLDRLLEIPELNAIQWIYGAGRGRTSDWLHVHRRCQAAGKGLQLQIAPDELDAIIANLRPEGVWLGVGGVRDRAQADAILRRVAAWR